MLPLEKALDASLDNKAIAITDLSCDYTAERDGAWIKVIERNHDEHYVRYHGFGNVEQAIRSGLLPSGWVPSKQKE